ncbi:MULTISPECIES: AAA family ATPase [Deefgea]|nr:MULTISPECIES: AAA family ATPase [Deefgea]MBM9888344.1 AAA family ATPase [Deefgea sp. CFH1-16]
MSLASKDGFRTYLAQQQKLADNTINSYCSGLNHLSSHCGQDLFALTDVQQLNALLARYIQGGADEEHGKYGNWAASNALRHWRDYVVSLEAGYESVLAHFASVPELAKQLNEHGQTALFCALAEDLHQCSADWWIVGNGEIRAGRTEHPMIWASAVVLEMKLAHQGLVYRLNTGEDVTWLPLSAEAASTLVERLGSDPRLSKLVNRAAYWPDDYEHMRGHLVITLTDGAIRNGYLAIPKTQQVFGEEYLGEEDKPASKLLTLHLPDGSAVQTQVLRNRKRLQKRFNSLFATEQLVENDRAIISLLDDGSYRLRFVRANEQLVLTPQDNTEVAMNQSEQTTSPLNQILFGPPGTGKTYHTINEALRILEPDFLLANSEPESRTKLKCRFDELVEEKRIRFVTFHQSFSYEDFVEGLRAEPDDSGHLRYKVENGVLKQLARDASHIEVAGRSTINVSDDARIWKVSIGGTGNSPLKDYCLRHGQARIGWSELGDMRKLDEHGRQYLDSLGSNDRNTAMAFAKEIAVGDVIVSINGQDAIGAIGVVTEPYFYAELPEVADNHYPHAIGVDWLYKDLALPARALNDGKIFTQKTVYELHRFKWPILLDAILKSGAKTEVGAEISSAAAHLPYVLIIDEINRGNISRIFGELITLIEPSKRAGADEELSVILPYSKEPFSVPNNVYLIGTMNTADRSLAGLDIALRRRFTFKEMPPKPVLLDGILVEGIDIGAMLRVMNQRIAVLLDRDHCLGHAYFMPLAAEGGNTLAKLAEIFEQNIIPLLQECFFEDWERIRWVLNDQNKGDGAFIVEDKELNVSQLFTNVPDKLRPIPRWRVNRKAFESIEAFRGIGRAEATADELGLA